MIPSSLTTGITLSTIWHMAAKIRLRDQEYEIRAGMTVRDALLKLEIQPEAVIPTRDGMLITEDEILANGDQIRLIAVISGG